MLDVYKMVARVAPTMSTVLVVGEIGHRQGAGGARDPHALAARDGAVRRGQLHARSPSRCSSRSCSATRRARSPARCAPSAASSRRRRAAPLFLDEIGDVAPRCRRSSCASSGGRDPARRRHRGRSRSTCAWWPRPTASSRTRSRRGASARTSTSASTSSRSGCRRCASGRATFRSSSSTSSPSTRRASGAPTPASRPRRMALSQRYAWPGNVRELRERHRARAGAVQGRRHPAVGSAARGRARAAVAPAAATGGGLVDDRPTLAELERRYIELILSETGGNKKRAAEILGIDRRTLYRTLERAATPPPPTRTRRAAEADEDDSHVLSGRSRPCRSPICCSGLGRAPLGHAAGGAGVRGALPALRERRIAAYGSDDPMARDLGRLCLMRGLCDEAGHPRAPSSRSGEPHAARRRAGVVGRGDARARSTRRCARHVEETVLGLFLWPEGRFAYRDEVAARRDRAVHAARVRAGRADRHARDPHGGDAAARRVDAHRQGAAVGRGAAARARAGRGSADPRGDRGAPRAADARAAPWPRRATRASRVCEQLFRAFEKGPPRRRGAERRRRPRGDRTARGSTTVAHLVRAAETMIDEGQHDEAATLLRSALALDPFRADARALCRRRANGSSRRSTRSCRRSPGAADRARRHRGAAVAARAARAGARQRTLGRGRAGADHGVGELETLRALRRLVHAGVVRLEKRAKA